MLVKRAWGSCFSQSVFVRMDSVQLENHSSGCMATKEAINQRRFQKAFDPKLYQKNIPYIFNKQQICLYIYKYPAGETHKVLYSWIAVGVYSSLIVSNILLSNN